MFVKSEKLLQQLMLISLKVRVVLLEYTDSKHWYSEATDSCIRIIVLQEQTSCKYTVNFIANKFRVEKNFHSQGEMWLTILSSSIIEIISYENCEVVAFSEIMVALSQFRHLGTISTSRFLLGVTNVRCDQSFIFGLAGLVAVRIFSSILQGIVEVLSCWR